MHINSEPLPDPCALELAGTCLRSLPVKGSDPAHSHPLGTVNKWFTIRMNPYWEHLAQRIDLRQKGFDPTHLPAHQRIGLVKTDKAVRAGIVPIARQLFFYFGTAGQSLGLNIHDGKFDLTGTDHKHRRLMSAPILLAELEGLFSAIKAAPSDPAPFIWDITWDDSLTVWTVPGIDPDDVALRMEILAEALDCDLRKPLPQGLSITLSKRGLTPCPSLAVDSPTR